MPYIRRSFNHVVYVLLALFATFAPEWAQAESNRSLWVGPTIARYMKEELPSYGQQSLGVGLEGKYEFELTSSFGVGIDLSYRRFAEERSLFQLGYGVSLRHDVLDMGKDQLFLSYGLLVQNISLESVRSSALAHDTKLAVGFSTESNLYAEFAYHISSLKYFGLTPVDMSYISLGGGYRFRWQK